MKIVLQHINSILPNIRLCTTNCDFSIELHFLKMTSLACLRHPHHISLVNTHSLRAKLNHAGDVYYNVDGLPSHHGVLAPKFDVFEIGSISTTTSGQNSVSTSSGGGGEAGGQSTTEWLVVGEVPGLRAEDITIEWLEEATLFIRGKLSTSAVPCLSEADALGQSETTNSRPLHKERHEGPFERSVTLPAKAEIKGVKAEVKDGLLFVRVPRKVEIEVME